MVDQSLEVSSCKKATKIALEVYIKDVRSQGKGLSIAHKEGSSDSDSFCCKNFRFVENYDVSVRTRGGGGGGGGGECLFFAFFLGGFFYYIVCMEGVNICMYQLHLFIAFASVIE